VIAVFKIRKTSRIFKKSFKIRKN